MVADTHKKRNLLIVTYFFPPSNKVGGRRWAKHAKYLHQSGINVSVLTLDHKSSVSAWDEDIKGFEKNIYRIAERTNEKPFFKRKLPLNIFEKIKWKVSLMLYSIRKSTYNQNLDDVSRQYIFDFNKELTRIVLERKVEVVLLTVGPFAYSSILTNLKKQNPRIKIIIDYRDKLENPLNEISKKAFEYCLAIENKVLETADLVLTVNDEITNHIQNRELSKSVYTLPHCVDEDYLNLKGLNISSPNSGIFIYGGELYNCMEKEVQDFVDFFNYYQTKTSSLAKANFYLSYSAYENVLGKNKHIYTSTYIDKKRYQEEVLKSNYILLFRPQWSTNALSSKFFEVLCFRKPILYFGEEGAVSKFITSNKLGLHINDSNFEEAIKHLTNSDKWLNTKYDLTKHSFVHYNKFLIDLLNNL